MYVIYSYNNTRQMLVVCRAFCTRMSRCCTTQEICNWMHLSTAQNAFFCGVPIFFLQKISFTQI